MVSPFTDFHDVWNMCVPTAKQEDSMLPKKGPSALSKAADGSSWMRTEN